MRRLAVLLALLLLLSSALAHGGGTDSKGGHMDRTTGEYHYHHGYSAHQHENGECPYGFEDKTGVNSGTSSGSGGSSADVYYRTTANVNMRSGASASSNLIVTIPEGAEVKYAGSVSGNWYMVCYGFKTGWVYKDYIVKSSRKTATPTVKPTTSPLFTKKPTTPETVVKANAQSTGRKELLPLTFGNVLLIFCAGLVVGLVFLFIYYNKTSNVEFDLKREAQEKVAAALERGQAIGEKLAEGRLSSKEVSLNAKQKELDQIQLELARKQGNYDKVKADFLDDATKILATYPKSDLTTEVLIAERPIPRSLYHSVDSHCITTGYKVSIRTAKELKLSPCPKCKPREFELIKANQVFRELKLKLDYGVDYRESIGMTKPNHRQQWNSH